MCWLCIDPEVMDHRSKSEARKCYINCRIANAHGEVTCWFEEAKAVAVIKIKGTEPWMAIMRKRQHLQSCTWRMTVHCACINLEPLELTGLRLCLHNLREMFTELKKKCQSTGWWHQDLPDFLLHVCSSPELELFESHVQLSWATPYPEPNSSCCQQRF